MAYAKICDCEYGQHCATCRARTRAELGGVASSRGDRWAESVAYRVGVARPWPQTEKMHRIALTKIGDIARGDEELASIFAALLETFAARRWVELQQTPDIVRRFKPAPIKRR